MVKENIPYYNFSQFPISNDQLLKIAESAVKSGVKMILINFGGYYPWTINENNPDRLCYTEKVIEHFVSFCRHHEIAIVPVVSFLSDCDFIVGNRKYSYLLKELNGKEIIDPSASGAGKFIEELIEDLFSLFIYSDHLLFELSGSLNFTNDKSDISLLLNRLSLYFAEESKYLIFSQDIGSNWENNLFYPGSSEEDIFYNGSYRVKIKKSILKISGMEYSVAEIDADTHFHGIIDITEFTALYEKFNGKVTDQYRSVLIVNDILISLDNLWDLIIKSREYLSLFYQNSDNYYKTRFLKNAGILMVLYSDLKNNTKDFIERYKAYYLPHIAELWVLGKVNSVKMQISELNLIADQIKGDSTL